MRSLRLRLLLPVALLMLGGCAGTVIETEINAAQNINPDAYDRPSPVIVRFYELKAPDAFMSADFYSLFDQEAAILGADLVAREEMALSPGEQRLINREVGTETRFVGVAAAFREIERARWRAVYPLEVDADNLLTIELNQQTVTIRQR